jgi:hypothetical protein
MVRHRAGTAAARVGALQRHHVQAIPSLPAARLHPDQVDFFEQLQMLDDVDPAQLRHRRAQLTRGVRPGAHQVEQAPVGWDPGPLRQDDTAPSGQLDVRVI